MLGAQKGNTLHFHGTLASLVLRIAKDGRECGCVPVTTKQQMKHANMRVAYSALGPAAQEVGPGMQELSPGEEGSGEWGPMQTSAQRGP